MKKILIILIIIIPVVVLTFFVFVKNGKDNTYFVVTGNDAAFALGDPVFVDRTISGFITGIRPLTDSTKHTLLSVELGDKINIPSRSELEAIRIDTNSNDVALNFKLISSEDYLHPGDTVLVAYDKINSAIRKTVHKAKPIEKLKDEKKQIEAMPVSIDTVPRIRYRVQFLISRDTRIPGSDVFKGLDEVFEYEHEGFYKYYVGDASNLAEAGGVRQKLIAMGFTDAFVVPFYRGKRISLSEAKALRN